MSYATVFNSSTSQFTLKYQYEVSLCKAATTRYKHTVCVAGIKNSLRPAYMLRHVRAQYISAAGCKFVYVLALLNPLFEYKRSFWI